jgi:3' terminal RNA ribose 2'-O-methyltransferase Hen1
VEKLLRHGEGWLENHPEKTYITGRYLSRRRSLVNLAFERLAEAEADTGPDDAEDADRADAEEKPETKLNLNAKRLGSVVAALKNCQAKSVIDLGCGEGRLLKLLVNERQFTNIAGMDVSHQALRRAGAGLKLEHAGERFRERISLFQGSLTYKDSRLSGYDAACAIEVIEHLDPPRLTAFERVLFEFTKPPVVIITTPNREYNVNYTALHADELRHGDHRFEWTRAEFRNWANETAETYDYTVHFSDIGDADGEYGAPTQMGVFTRCE